MAQKSPKAFTLKARPRPSTPFREDTLPPVPFSHSNQPPPSPSARYAYKTASIPQTSTRCSRKVPGYASHAISGCWGNLRPPPSSRYEVLLNQLGFQSDPRRVSSAAPCVPSGERQIGIQYVQRSLKVLFNCIFLKQSHYL